MQNKKKFKCKIRRVKGLFRQKESVTLTLSTIPILSSIQLMRRGSSKVMAY